jgi:predicted lipoprotein with Yx(FWY)xxD motif
MPEHPARGPSRRGIAAALIVPATAVAAIFTASSVASGTTTESAAQQPTNLPTEISPTGGGATGTRSPHTGTGTATRSPSPTRTATPTGTGTGVVPGVPSGTAVSCVSGTATPTRTGTAVPGVPSPTGTRTTGPTGPTRTATGGPTATGPTAPTAAPTAPGTGTANVPGAAQTETGTPTRTGTATANVQTTIKLGTAGGKSNVLVDSNGCALYMDTSDTTERTDVSTAQESTWHPVPAPAQVTGPGLDQAKVGTFTRPDGEHQATYAGHQLYRFAGDRAPGEAKGQGVDGKFFLVDQNGASVR